MAHGAWPTVKTCTGCAAAQEEGAWLLRATHRGGLCSWQDPSSYAAATVHWFSLVSGCAEAIRFLRVIVAAGLSREPQRTVGCVRNVCCLLPLYGFNQKLLQYWCSVKSDPEVWQ